MRGDLFDLEEERLGEEIKKRGAEVVLLQLPDGLKPLAARLASIVERAGASVIISGEPCYGACDVALAEARELNADLIIHYGHTMMLKDLDIPTIYFEAHAKISVEKAVRRAIGLLKPWRRIGLATTVQHVENLEAARRILSSAGKEVYVGKVSEILYPGQVLGCDYTNAKVISSNVEAFLFVGGGRFHPLGLALATMKPVVAADPFEDRAYSLNGDAKRILKRRWAEIEEARKAETDGVIIGLKPGQKRLKEALRVKEKIEEMRKKAYLISLREITDQKLRNFQEFEAYINTACPRISIDEASAFRQPVLTLKEAYVMLGEISWEKLLEEGII